MISGFCCDTSYFNHNPIRIGTGRYGAVRKAAMNKAAAMSMARQVDRSGASESNR